MIMVFMFRSRPSSAANTKISMIFTNSEGWKEKIPILIQLLAPNFSEPSTTADARNTPLSTIKIRHKFGQILDLRIARVVTIMQTMPITIHTSCFMATLGEMRN